MGCGGSTQASGAESFDASVSAKPRGSHSGSRQSAGFYDAYQLEKKVLGRGSYATVKEAVNKHTGQHVAVKCVSRNNLPIEDETALRMEVKILRELHHKNIVTIMEFFEDKKYFFLVMEQLRGGELFERIVRKTYYNEKEARDVCRILLGAIAFVHHHGVVHRDLKPENLLMVSQTSDSNVKIADFGFAVHEKPGGLRAQCGTPGYVAPEILKGVSYDRAVDMWSTGVIVYILLGGYPPFNDSDQTKLYKKIRRGKFTFHEKYWSHISDEAKDLITRMLTVDPTKRISAEGALRHPWFTHQRDSALSARSLGANLEQFRLFNARRKFRSAIQSVVVARLLTHGFPEQTESSDVETEKNSGSASAPHA